MCKYFLTISLVNMMLKGFSPVSASHITVEVILRINGELLLCWPEIRPGHNKQDPPEFPAVTNPTRLSAVNLAFEIKQLIIQSAELKKPPTDTTDELCSERNSAQVGL